MSPLFLLNLPTLFFCAILFQIVAQGMGLDTRTHTSLWKDRAVIEINAAVLYSFQVLHTLHTDIKVCRIKEKPLY